LVRIYQGGNAVFDDIVGGIKAPARLVVHENRASAIAPSRADDRVKSKFRGPELPKYVRRGHLSVLSPRSLGRASSTSPSNLRYCAADKQPVKIALTHLRRFRRTRIDADQRQYFVGRGEFSGWASSEAGVENRLYAAAAMPSAVGS